MWCFIGKRHGEYIIDGSVSRPEVRPLLVAAFHVGVTPRNAARRNATQRNITHVGSDTRSHIRLATRTSRSSLYACGCRAIGPRRRTRLHSNRGRAVARRARGCDRRRSRVDSRVSLSLFLFFPRTAINGQRERSRDQDRSIIAIIDDYYVDGIACDISPMT